MLVHNQSLSDIEQNNKMADSWFMKDIDNSIGTKFLSQKFTTYSFLKFPQFLSIDGHLSSIKF